MVDNDSITDLYALNQPQYLVCSSLDPRYSFVKADKGFLLAQVLDEGSYSTIFLGHQWYFDDVKGWHQVGEMVVIKLLRHGLLYEAMDYERYRSGHDRITEEADYLFRMQVKRPSVRVHVPRVNLDGFGNVDYSSKVYGACGRPHGGRSQPFLIMEYLRGGDLWSLTHQGMVFDEQRAYDAFSDILRALERLHSRGICHRDLKPDNVAFEDDPRTNPSASLRLIDLGLAENIDGAPFEEVVGTEGWHAPEVVALYRGETNKGFDKSVDIYGAGAILGWLLAAYWNPVESRVQHAPLAHAADHWMSLPASESYKACIADVGKRATLSTLQPMTKKWKKHLTREAQQEFDNCYQMQPLGRDCRLVPHSEQARDVFDKFEASILRFQGGGKWIIANGRSTQTSSWARTFVDVEPIHAGNALRKFPPPTPDPSVVNQDLRLTASKLMRDAAKAAAWWDVPLALENGLKKLLRRQGGRECRKLQSCIV